MKSRTKKRLPQKQSPVAKDTVRIVLQNRPHNICTLQGMPKVLADHSENIKAAADLRRLQPDFV